MLQRQGGFGPILHIVLTSLALALGLVLGTPPASTEGCELGPVIAGVQRLAPELGVPKVRYRRGVLELQFGDSESRPVAFLAVQLSDGRLSTATTAPRLSPENREGLNSLGPALTGDQGVLAVLTKCPAGSGEVAASVEAWESAFRDGRDPFAAGAEHESDAGSPVGMRASFNPDANARPLPRGERQGDPTPLVAKIRKGPGTTLAFGMGGLLVALGGIFWRRRVGVE